MIEKIINKIRENMTLYIISLNVIILILIGIIIMNLSSTKAVLIQNNDNIDIKEIISKKETKIIYVYSSDSKKCKYCSKTTKFLKDNQISYLSYDIEQVTKDNYQELLSSLKIDSKLFGYPSLIYIKEGEMFGNIIHIDDIEVLKKFINEYDLKLL